MSTERTFLAGTNDSGYLRCSAATASDAQDGLGLIDVVNDALRAGQEDDPGSSDFLAYEAFLYFDTSEIPDGAIISAATLELFCVEIQNASGYTIEAKDWESPTSIDAGDWETRASLGALATRATLNDTDLTINTYETFIDTALAAVVNKSGNTVLMLATNRQRLGDIPTGREWAAFQSATQANPPKLTVVYNTAPTAPILGTRGNFDATAQAVFPWTPTDPDAGFGDAQTAYQLEIYRVSDGALVFDSTKTLSAISSHTLAAATLANGNQYQWRVRTWDEDDVVGPYSQLQSFHCSAAPTATITSPTEAQVIDSPEHTATHTYSDPESEAQSARQYVLKVAGSPVFDTGKVSGTTLSQLLTNLADDTAYVLDVTVWDAKDIKSATATRNFTVDYTPPPTPTIAVSDQGHFLQVAITNPAPGPGVPLSAYNDIYRRIAGESTWVRIATMIPANGTYDDYAVASEKSYEYKARGVGGGTFADSATASESVTLKGIWIHDVADSADTVHNFRYDQRGRSFSRSYESQSFRFAGRTFPVTEFGDGEDVNVRVLLQTMKDEDDLEELRSLLARKATLCYRDERGRKVFGTADSLPENDHIWGDDTEFSMTATDHSEKV